MELHVNYIYKHNLLSSLGTFVDQIIDVLKMKIKFINAV